MIFQAQNLSMKVNFKQHKTFVICLISFTFTIVLTVCLVIPIYYILVGVVHFHLLLISCFYLTIYMCVFALEFIFSCLMLRERFKLINKYLW